MYQPLESPDYLHEHPEMFSKQDNTCYIVNDESSKIILNSRKETLIELENTVPANISLYDSGVSFLINIVKFLVE